MAKLSQNADDQSKSLDDHVAEVMSSIAVTTQPVVVCGVQRKANIGNFENIDIYCAVALPVDVTGDDRFDIEKLNEKLSDVAKFGFHVASSETLSRYQVVKESSR